MKKKEQHILVGTAIGGVSGGLLELLSQYLDSLDQNKPFKWGDVDWEQVFKKTAGGMLVGGLIGWGYYQLRFLEEANEPFSPSGFLYKRLVHIISETVRF